jgi:FkbM family methyltransferase
MRIAFHSPHASHLRREFAQGRDLVFLAAASRRSRTRIALERLWLRALPHVTRDYSWAAVDGFRMYGSAPHQRYLGRLRTGRVEPFTVRLFREAIRPGMVVADVGAYVGLFTLVAARELNGAGTVFSFECHPANHRFLLHNIRLNGLADRVVASSFAVANEIGRLRFRAPGGDLSTGSLLASHDHREAVDVPATTLDHALDGRPVDVLKMDIEGGEVRARSTAWSARSWRHPPSCSSSSATRARSAQPAPPRPSSSTASRPPASA